MKECWKRLDKIKAEQLKEGQELVGKELIMDKPNKLIVNHYTKGSLFEQIMGALKALGKDASTLSLEDLKPVDEFHIGGLQATDHLLDQLEIRPKAKVLDIGSGIGGPARHLASRYGAQVTGIDLTPEFVETADRLTQIVGLSVSYQVGSALDMPLNDAEFDLATLIHVGMNVPDKQKLFSEAARVLRTNGTFAVYDVMQLGAEHPDFPLPWASTPEASFLDKPKSYRTASAIAGFEQVAEEERGEFAREFFKKLAASIPASGPPPLGLGIIMGADVQMKIGNMVKGVEGGSVAPIEMIFRKLG